MADEDKFVVGIDEFVEEADQLIQGLGAAIALDALAVLKEKTPVKTGNLRASWTPYFEKTRTTIATGVHYARRVEFGFVGEDSAGRSFNQKGRGMVQQTISELPEIAKRTVERLKAK